MEREGRPGRRRITGRGAPVAVGHRAATGVLRGPNWFRAPRRRRSRGTGRPPASPAPGSIELATLIGRTQSIGVPCAGVDSVPRRDRLTAMARGAGHRRLASPAPARALRAAPCRAVVRGGARSYLRAPPRYDLAREGTTARIRVRPRGIRYDRAGLPWARVELSRSFAYFHGETPARVSRGRGRECRCGHRFGGGVIADSTMSTRARPYRLLQAEEAGDRLIARVRPQRLGRIKTQKAPGVHDADPVGHHPRLPVVVGDVQGGRPLSGQDLPQVDGELLAQCPVERAQGLVEQQQPRPGGQRPRQRHALRLPARQSRDVPRAVARQTDELQHLLDTGPPLAARQTGQAVGDVAGDVAEGEELAVLEHEAEAAPVDRHAHHVPPVPHDRPARQVLQPGDGAQQRGLPAPRGPQKGDCLATGHVEIDAVDGRDAGGAARPPVDDPQAAQAQAGRRRLTTAGAGRAGGPRSSRAVPARPASSTRSADGCARLSEDCAGPAPVVQFAGSAIDVAGVITHGFPPGCERCADGRSGATRRSA